MDSFALLDLGTPTSRVFRMLRALLRPQSEPWSLMEVKDRGPLQCRSRQDREHLLPAMPFYRPLLPLALVVYLFILPLKLQHRLNDTGVYLGVDQVFSKYLKLRRA